jgi:thiosulfate/3-mercaptopyruvate sulfurtransferase
MGCGGEFMIQELENKKLASTSWLEENLGKPSIRIVEIAAMMKPDAYFEGHIPGAVHWPWKETLWHATSREFLSPYAFSQLMEKSGIGHNTTIVLYSNESQFANYAFWVCTMRGHSKLKLLYGKKGVWINEKRPITQESPQIEPTKYPIRATDESCRIGREGILAGLNNPDRVLLDLRSPQEYKGEMVSPPKYFPCDHGAERKGHIPGARHLFYGDFLYEDERYKPVSEIRDAYYKLGATPDKEIVCYCRLSHRGSMGWFVARYLLGFSRVRVYDGSWTEWGSIVGMPIENESLA